jgi:glycosyltransferase involved in cell wall biosynthesis
MARRILFIEGNTDGTVGGSYFVLYDLVKGLDRSRFHPIVGFHRDNYLIEKMRADGLDVVLFDSPAPFVFKSKALNLILAPLKRAINMVRGFVLPAFAHARYLKEHKIDLVNLNNSILRNHPWMLAAMLTGTKCITHEMGINTHYTPMARFFARRMLKIICVSRAVQAGMRACGIDYQHITVIHCGIELSRYQKVETPDELRRKHGLPADAPVIGVVGNVKVWKGQETLVRAVALLKPKFPNIRCLLVGASTERDKDYRDKLEGLCRESGIVENVIFAGFQRNSTDYMALMDVVAHTSIDPEPFGIVTLEAMSRARPLVSTTIGGPAEVVIHGETGLLVEPGKPELLANAVASLLNDKEKASAMGQRGLQRLSEFSMQKNLDKTMAVYAELLEKPIS